MPPLVFVLDEVQAIITAISDPFLKDEFPGFLFFGGNGGLERIALDLHRGRERMPVVMIDPIAGPESAEEIAPDFQTFVLAVGLEAAPKNSG